MKKMIEILVAIKGQGAMLFGGAAFLYVVVGWWFGYDAVPSIILVQMGVLSMICAGLAYLCFVVDTKHKPAERVAGFLILMYIILTASAYFGSWFTFTLTTVLIFTGIFIVLSAILFGVYGAYFRITGTRYNQMLTAYKARHSTGAQ
jgi:hypothetical protein